MTDPKSETEDQARKVGSDKAESDARFRSLIEAAPDGVVISRDGIIKYMNQSAGRILGYDDPNELLGKPMTVFLEREQVPIMRARLQATVREGRVLRPQEYRAKHKNGSTIIAEITSLPIEFAGGPAVLAFARDVTDRASFQEHLSRTERMAALGTLAAGVAHEINNPLAFLTLGSESLAELLSRPLDADAQKQASALVDDLRSGLARVAEIVRGLGAFSRVDEEALRGVDIEKAVRSAAKLLRHELDGRVRVTVDAFSAPRVHANVGRLEQVFVNLILNASQAIASMPNQGEGLVDIVSSETASGSVLIRVRDNGPGIPRSVVDRIFDPFFTTKPVGMGTGLGLSVCHRIIREFGGEISLESIPQQGTTILIELDAPHPGDLDEVQAVSQYVLDSTRTDGQKPAPVASVPDRLRILVVDDEPRIREMVAEILSSDHQVGAAGSAEEALSLIETGGRFDIVLCDVAMPGMSGIALAEHLEEAHPELPIKFVFMTGGAFRPGSMEFFAGSGRHRLDKPFTIAELTAAIVKAATETALEPS